QSPRWVRRLALRARRGGCARCAALQPFLQPHLILRKLLPRVAARERREEPADDPVPVEVELEREARAPTLVERLDGDRAPRADRPVETPERGLPRRVVLGDLVCDLLPAAGDASRVDRTRADAGRPLR